MAPGQKPEGICLAPGCEREWTTGRKLCDPCYVTASKDVSEGAKLPDGRVITWELLESLGWAAPLDEKRRLRNPMAVAIANLKDHPNPDTPASK